MLGIPGTGRLILSHFNDDVAKLEDFRGSNRRALRGVDSWLLVRQIPVQRSSMCQRLAWHLVADGFHNETGRIRQPDAIPVTGMFRFLDRRRTRDSSELFQFFQGLHGKSEPDKTCMFSTLDTVTICSGVGGT
ncbi:hypothetical protein D3C81_1428370 [compost metagenome]